MLKLVEPKRLLPASGNIAYKVSLLSHKPLPPHAAVNMCFIGNSGDSFLMRICQTDDPQSFNGPDIGGVASLLVAPEDEKMFLNEVVMTVDDTQYVFPYNNLIGQGYQMAAHLAPFDQVNLAEMKPIYDTQYMLLKEKSVVGAADIAILGSLVQGIFFGVDKGVAFAIGGVLGTLYMKMLQDEVSFVGQENTYTKIPSIRLATTVALSVLILSHYRDQVVSDYWLYLSGVFGFATYRIALLTAYFKNVKQ